LAARRLYKLICVQCKNEFFPSSRKRKYCSLNCYHVKRNSRKENLINNNEYSCLTHGVMSVENFYINARNRYQCIICDKARSKRYRETHIEKVKEDKRLYYLNNLEKSRLRTKIWKKNNNDKVKINAKKYRTKNKQKICDKRKSQIEELKRYYVKSCMVTTLKINEIPEEVIDLKRTLMLLRRKIKENE